MQGLVMEGPSIQLSPAWFTDMTTQSSLAKRIRDLIIGGPQPTWMDMIECDRVDTDEPRWLIDPVANNWFLHMRPAANEIRLVHRYGWTPGVWQAIKLVIETVVK
jgi:hypothetical protein